MTVGGVNGGGLNGGGLTGGGLNGLRDPLLVTQCHKRRARLLVQQPPDRARRLRDPVLVLDQREADVAVAALAEADPGADGDLGVARQAQGELERAEGAE